eukprot:765427-Hanusia_phi.AAC.1
MSRVWWTMREYRLERYLLVNVGASPDLYEWLVNDWMSKEKIEEVQGKYPLLHFPLLLPPTLCESPSVTFFPPPPPPLLFLFLTLPRADHMFASGKVAR